MSNTFNIFKQPFIFCLFISLGSLQAQPLLNQLSPEEQKAGWTLLFDGKTTRNWHLFSKPGIMNPQWKVEDGTLTLTGKGGGDIVTDLEYTDFEFQVDWKISVNGNSGIFFRVSEDTLYKAVWHTGPEMQILDDQGHQDGKFPTHRAGANYDLTESLHPLEKKPGEWNTAHIKVEKGHVTYTLNGHKTAEYQIDSPEWLDMVAKSKFKNLPGYGRMKKGRIALQDHGDQVWFRNIKIRPI
jgi:hypothetical protein